MNLKNFVATGIEAPQYFRKPFRIGSDDKPWCCACDEMALVGVQVALQIPAFRGAQKDAEVMLSWLTADQPDKAVVMRVPEILEWMGSTEEQRGIILDVQIDRGRLTRLLKALPGGSIALWNACETVGVPSLTLSQRGVWRAILAGYDEVEEGVPRFQSQAELFNLAMSLES